MASVKLRRTASANGTSTNTHSPARLGARNKYGAARFILFGEIELRGVGRCRHSLFQRGLAAVSFCCFGIYFFL